MSIGLYDADFFTYHQTIFNLEIMKLATYFKKKREITIMAPSFIPERYSHFYYRKDFNDGHFPTNLNQFDNVKYGGFAFSNNRYIALPPEVEQCAPDVSVYDRYKDIFIEDNKGKRISFNTQMRGLHCRLSLDGISIWDKFEKQIPRGSRARVLLLHDFNLANIEGATDTIHYLMKKYSVSESVRMSLCNKFPIKSSDFNEFIKWMDFIFASIYFNIQFNGMLEDEQIVEITSKINPSNSFNIFYNPVPASSDKNDFLEKDLLKIFKQVLFLYRNQKQFLLIYNDSFQIPQEIKNLFNLFTIYGRSGITPPTSLFYFVKGLRTKKKFQSDIINLDEAIEVFSYVQQNYPELFKLFYEASGAELKGGEFQVVR